MGRGRGGTEPCKGAVLPCNRCPPGPIARSPRRTEQTAHRQHVARTRHSTHTHEARYSHTFHPTRYKIALASSHGIHGNFSQLYHIKHKAWQAPSALTSSNWETWCVSLLKHNLKMPAYFSLHKKITTGLQKANNLMRLKFQPLNHWPCIYPMAILLEAPLQGKKTL